MQPEADVLVVHSYDTEHRRVRCGVRGGVRSTKHRSGVTCPACLRLLSEEHRGDAASSGQA